MIALLLSLAVAATPSEALPTDRFDLLEVNHYYDCDGKHVFDQLICWDWHAADQTHHVEAWRMLRCVAELPVYDADRRDFRTLYRDSDGLRLIVGRALRETWTQYDPELLDRGSRPQSKRRGLLPSQR